MTVVVRTITSRLPASVIKIETCLTSQLLLQFQPRTHSKWILRLMTKEASETQATQPRVDTANLLWIHPTAPLVLQTQDEMIVLGSQTHAIAETNEGGIIRYHFRIPGLMFICICGVFAMFSQDILRFLDPNSLDI